MSAWLIKASKTEVPAFRDLILDVMSAVFPALEVRHWVQLTGGEGRDYTGA